MYARKRLDISWADLASGMLYALFRRDERSAAREVEQWFGPGALAFLSVRSGLDLYLRLLALPRGSEVLVSALTIPDMCKVLEEHGLVPVPVDLDPRTLTPLEERLRALCGPRTRAILVAHLFGTRIDLEPCAKLARERGLLLLEDSAQAFTGLDYKGNRLADVSMFSFGPIKTATALAGGVLVVRDTQLCESLRAEQERYPLQGSWAYFARLWKYVLLKGLTLPLPYALFVRYCAARGRSVDSVIQGTVRGFKGGDFFQKIRHRPSAALLALIGRRLRQADGTRIAARVRAALQLRQLLGTNCELPGGDAPFHSYWVFTLACSDPQALIERLRQAGFDATQAATLRPVAAPAGRPEAQPHAAQEILSRTVYVPLYPEMSARAIERLARVLLESGAGEVQPRVAGLELSHSS